MKKITRQTVITKVQQYQNNTKVINKAIKDTIKTGINDTKIQQIENEIKNEYNGLIRESNIRQMEDEIKKEHKRLIQQQKTKQTADVLIFKRYDNKGEIPEGKKIAFRDNDGKPYVIKIRRYFIIDSLNAMDTNKYKGKRIYDYYDNNLKRYDFDRVIKLLRTSEDFDYEYKTHKDYINCILIKSLTNTNNKNKVTDLLDEDLFMSNIENGVYNRYLNIDLDKRKRNINDNSCFVKLIIKRFQKAFVRASYNKSYKFDLTIETLCNLCEIEYKNENIGLSINKSLTFFKKFKLGLHVFGPFGTIFQYKPEKRNKNLNPSNLFIYILNNHCYEINQNTKEFEQLHWKSPISDYNLSNEVNSLNVSDRYNIRQQSINKECTTFVNTIDEVIDIIKSYVSDHEEIIVVPIIYNDYLDKLLFGIINNLGYMPEIKMMSGKITSLLVKYSNILFNITLSDTKANDTDVWIDKDNYELYNTIDDTFYNGLICQEHMSTYNKQTLYLTNWAKIRVPCRTHQTPSSGN